MTFDCPQCGLPTETLHEGYCEPCRDRNQRELNEHNLCYDAWQAMSDEDRAEVIQLAISKE